MFSVKRVTAEEARPRVQAGDALLVCAYDKEEKFQANHLEGAIRLAEFKERVPSLDKNTEVVFYCA